jgi:hypothetical protein
LTGCGFPCGTPFLRRGIPRHRPVRGCLAPDGRSWPLGSSLAQEVPCPRWPVGAPEGVALLARGGSNSWSEPSRWASLSINTADPVEVHLANVPRQSAVEQVASSSALQYEHAWRSFVQWCGSLQVPRSFLPASEVTVAKYLANLAEQATSFSVIKSASAAIAYHQKINLYDHNPTISPLATFVRAAFARRLGTAP